MKWNYEGGCNFKDNIIYNQLTVNLIALVKRIIPSDLYYDVYYASNAFHLLSPFKLGALTIEIDGN